MEESGMSFEIHQYLNRPPKVTELKSIINLLGVKPLQVIRKNESVLKELNIDLTSLNDNQLIELMHTHPIIIERPIVFTDKQAIIGRPPENVLDILD